MNVFILEGENDAVFTSSLMCWHFRHPIPADATIIDSKYSLSIKRGINILKEYLVNNHYYFKIKDTLGGVIIYGDNGKETVIQHILPTLVMDTIRRIPEPEKLYLLTILDGEGIEKSNQIAKISQNLHNKISKNHWEDRYNIEINHEFIKIIPTRDYRYAIIIKLFQIPQSLEYQIVHEAITTLNISKRKRRMILNDEPHQALREIQDLMHLSKEELIKECIEKEWFKDKSWYINLLEDISTFFKLDRVR